MILRYSEAGSIHYFNRKFSLQIFFKSSIVSILSLTQIQDSILYGIEKRMKLSLLHITHTRGHFIRIPRNHFLLKTFKHHSYSLLLDRWFRWLFFWSRDSYYHQKNWRDCEDAFGQFKVWRTISRHSVGRRFVEIEPKFPFKTQNLNNPDGFRYVEWRRHVKECGESLWWNSKCSSVVKKVISALTSPKMHNHVFNHFKIAFPLSTEHHNVALNTRNYCVWIEKFSK